VRRRYFAGVSFVDDQVGRVLSALDDRDLLDNTWVIYTSDHGEMLGSHGLFTKWLFYEDAVRVPLIIRPPGGRDELHVESLVEHVDLAATIRSLAGADDFPGGAGHRLVTKAGEPTGVERDTVRSECEGFGMWRTDRYKVVVHEATGTIEQMFDLANDPDESRDVKDFPEYAPTRDALMRTLVLPALLSV
jgi:arylsulfatase A-like enzyme